MPPFATKLLTAMTCMAVSITYVNIVHADDAATKVIKIANEVCAGCHGVDGNSLVPTFPKLAGQQKVYLLRELTDYKTGKRVSETMAPFMESLTLEDLPHIAAHYAKQKPAPGIVSNPSLLAVGKALYLQGNSKTDVPSCDSCHEEDGSGSGKFPRVAGQHSEYTLDQFRLYATGKRTNGARVMKAIAERMSEEESRAVAEYMASMP